MRARRRVGVSVALSTTYRGRLRRESVWVMRYRLPSGKDSRMVLGPAWTKKGRPAAGYLTEGDALLRMEAFAVEHSVDIRDVRRSFRVALDAFLRDCEQERGLRGSTLHDYRKIGNRLAGRPWRGGLSWAERPLDTFTDFDLIEVRRELLAAGRAACTLNHYRRVLRGVFGTHVGSPANGWVWKAERVESEGKLRFYTPEQVRKLVAEASCALDGALCVRIYRATPLQPSRSSRAL